LPGVELARATELEAEGDATGIVFHDVDETSTRFCERDANGVLWFVLPGGPRWELATTVDDPLIANKGDGAFHPFELAEVRAAFEALQFPRAALRADVYLLPYPRRSA